MDMTLPPPGQGTAPVNLAKAALRRLAMVKLEPTPDNYARAYAFESGEAVPAVPPRLKALLEPLVGGVTDSSLAREELLSLLGSGRWDDAARVIAGCARTQRDERAAQGLAWTENIEVMLAGLEHGSRSWPLSARKESLHRVLVNSHGDALRLRTRLARLVQAWCQDVAEPALRDEAEPPGVPLPVAVPELATLEPLEPLAPLAPAPGWPAIMLALAGSLYAALPSGERRAAELRGELDRLVPLLRGGDDGVEVTHAVADLCRRAVRLLAHRHGLLADLGRLCSELTEGLIELAEDGSWARGQCEVMRQGLAEGISARSVRAASEVLAETRKRQSHLHTDRNEARHAIKELIARMLSDLGRLGEDTGRFGASVSQHALAIEQADSIESLAGVVRQIVQESQAVQVMVSETQARLRDEHSRASQMELRVQALESELRRLSDEVATDLLTQVANRRGLVQAFKAECARIESGVSCMGLAQVSAVSPLSSSSMAALGLSALGLSIGLIDIDNFKKLNDSLGHAAGDKALQTLSAKVKAHLRACDTVARFGGEEFVVLLPDMPAPEAQQFLTRMQRSLSAALFMHENKEVLVTFSAGVTAWRHGETLEAALERSDEALYEAKRTGKNRTCVG